MRSSNHIRTRRNLHLLFLSLGLEYAFAQQVSYPLHTGDEWQYGSFIPNAPWQVTTDTLMPNSKTYRIITSQGYPLGYLTFYWQYHRQEGNKVFSYNSSSQQEFVIFDFDANVGDTISTYPNQSSVGRVIVWAKNIDTLFGIPRRHWEFYHDVLASAVDEEIKLEITDTLGITRFSNVNGPGGRITGARISGQSYGTVTSVRTEMPPPIVSFRLDPLYPNPFNPQTAIHLVVQQSEYITVRVYDVLGRHIATISSGILGPGEHVFHWIASSMPSGLYFVRAQGESSTQSQTGFLVK